jgi:multicomponent Na+:H+ antiporter subunit G
VTLSDALTVSLILAGCYFFLAGTLGLVRFPDVLSRLHAVTKADNLGLGFIVAGLAVQSGSLLVAIKLVSIWILVLLASATSCYLIARGAQPDLDGKAGD